MSHYFGVNLLRKERHSMSPQINLENTTHRIFQLAKEGEFRPVHPPSRSRTGSTLLALIAAMLT